MAEPVYAVRNFLKEYAATKSVLTTELSNNNDGVVSVLTDPAPATADSINGAGCIIL
jgi:hypothetical protein